jgi:hypothetical protein
MVTETELFEFTDLIPLDFSSLGLMKSEANKTAVDTQDKLLARILDAAARIKKREHQLRRTTRDLHTRVAECTEVDAGIFKHLM